jgi:CheY-like chemotaxis protein
MREPLNILVVDDDPALAAAARALLSRRNCHLEAVFSGLDAVARLRAGGIDAVLLDVGMPEVDGLSVLAEIERLPNPPRVVLMSSGIDAKVDAAVAAGRAVACLPKPVDFEMALVLLQGEAPEHPLQLVPRLDRAGLAGLASQMLVRGTVFLEGAPQLPPSTPVSLTLALPSGTLTLLAMADAAARPAGKWGLGLRLSALTAPQQQALRSLGPQVPEGTPASREALPSRPQELYLRGIEKMDAGKYDMALPDLRAARDLDPGNPLYGPAVVLAEDLAGMEKARNLFRQAEKISEKDPREALRLLQEAIRLDPSRASYHREAARLSLHLQLPVQQAEEWLGAAIHLAPSDPAPRLHLAQLLERAGRPKEALWACEAAISLFPNDPELVKIAARLRRKAPG